MQKITKDPDNLYFNIRINRGGDRPDPRNYTNIATYEATLNNPIIDDPSQYYLAVTDYSIPLESIPINIVRVIPNQPNPNLMTSVFTLNYLGIDYSENITYIPSANTSPPVQNQQFMVVTNYYFMYSYGFLLESFNNTLANLVTAASIPLPLGTRTPYFFFDNRGSFPNIKLVVPSFFITNNITFGFNDQALNYFGGYDIFYNFSNPNSRHQIAFLVNNNECDASGNLDPAGAYYLYQQQYYALPQWNVLNRIIISSSSLPVANQQTSSNNILSPDAISLSPILYVEIPNYENISQSKNYSYMNDDAQYRLIDLISTIPLKRFQISVSWSDHFGEIFPLFLQAYNSCNIQLGFFKKDLYKSIK